jgi:hypothetical protein
VRGGFKKYDLVALVLDGKSFAQDEMVLALGITIEGKKVILGFVQTATENARVLREFLKGLNRTGVKDRVGLTLHHRWEQGDKEGTRCGLWS